MDWLSKIFDIHKLPFKVISWITVVSGILLFAPSSFIDKLKLSGFLSSYGPYIGVVFVSATALFSINTIGWLSLKVRKKAKYSKWKKELRNVLENLDHAEKAVLREFFIQGQYTIELPMDNPTVVGLRNKGIIYIAGEYGQRTLAGMLIPFAVNDEAGKLIDLAIVDLPAGELSDEDVQHLHDSRPDFALEIERRKALYKL